MNTLLPDTWPLVRLKDVATIRYGKALHSDSREAKGTVPVYGSSQTSGLHDVAYHDKPSIIIGRKGSVGSVQYVDVPFWPIDTVFFLDEVSPHVDLRFLAAALSHFDLERYKIVVGVPGLNRDDLANFKFPLPPLSEQQRIVDILQEAEEIRRLRAQAEAKTTELIPAMFREFFGEIGTNSQQWPVVPVSRFVESFQGGKSLMGSDTELDERLPRVLKISAVTSGLLIPSESKALPANYEAPEEHRVREGDLLITRANTEELVGATALVWKDCPDNLLLPDKIWRFKWKNDFDGTPEFVWALFQQTATRKALGNIASGTGGSMKNISMAKLMKMRVIWPPKKLQDQFSKALREILELSNDTTGAKLARSLTGSLSAHAFTGQLTEGWREKYQKKLVSEARDRDTALQKAGLAHPLARRATIQEMDRIWEDRTDGIYAELNREQRGLLKDINRMVGGVDYARYFTAEQLAGYLDGPMQLHPQAIEAHLQVLAIRGLIIPVSRQRNDTTSDRFAACYRLPISDSSEEFAGTYAELSRSADDVKASRMKHQRNLATGNL